MSEHTQLTNHHHLHRAALSGDDDSVTRALHAGADINALDEEGRTPIMCAVAGDRWQEIDASDALFLTPQRLNAIRIMLNHPQISLHCLNAPHAAANGVIPLSMAAWLNFPDLVQLLLEESADTVAVDALDAHGATALMYAARDNSLKVIQLLLSHGARPDLRDCNFRSSIQYAIPHPRVLWLCESILRRHRWRESQSPDSIKLSVDAYSGTTIEELLSLAQCSLPSLNEPSSSSSSTNTLIDPPPKNMFTSLSLTRSVKTLVSTLSDTSFLRSILFSPALPTDSPASLYPLSVPVLVNRPDEQGWSVIHHACSFIASPNTSSSSSKSQGKIPEIEVLDTLYLAGADLSLFTTEEHYTPLHVLAKTSASLPPSTTTTTSISPVVKQQIQDFITHLVRDLGAALAAQDKHDETCLHLAAEYGSNSGGGAINKVVLDVLLDLDRVLMGGRVSRMKNTRGLVAADLAVTQEIKDSFRAMRERMDVAATIRRGSVSSALSDNTIRGGGSSEKHYHHSLTTTVMDEFGVPQQSSPNDEDGDGDGGDIDPIEHTQVLLAYMRTPIPTRQTLDQMDIVTATLVKHFQARIETCKKEVDAARKRRETTRATMRLLDASLLARDQLRLGGGGRSGNSRFDVGRTLRVRKSWTRESEDSQFTRVSCGSDIGGGGGSGEERVDVATQAAMGIAKGEFGATGTGTAKGQAQGWAEWFEGLIHHNEDGTIKKKKDKKDKVKLDVAFGNFNGGGGDTTTTTEFGSVEKLARKAEKEKGTLKLKTWWRKVTVMTTTTTTDPSSRSLGSGGGGKSGSNEKLSSSSSPRSPQGLGVVHEIQDPALCAVGREVKYGFSIHHSTSAAVAAATASFSSLALADDVDTDPHSVAQKFMQRQQAAVRLAEDAEREGEWTIGKALRTAPIVLGAAKNDLERIEQYLKNADEYLGAAEASLQRVGRVLKRAFKKRRAIIEELARSRTATPTPFTPERQTSPNPQNSPVSPGSPGLLGYDLTLSLRPSYASISTIMSDCSVLTTTTTHHTTQDDDETRTMRRLLLRRIEAQLRGAYDEVDRVVNWIKIVQGVVDGVKRRTYL